MRLLLTRSAGESGRTREKLAAAGHNVIVSPVIETVATGAALPTGVVDALFATSAQAFAIPLDGLAFEARRLLPLFLVGGRTLDAAHAAGFLGAATTARNAAALADMFRELPERPRRTVYLAGLARKPDLENAFAEMGQALDVVEVYDAQPVTTFTAEASDAFARHSVDGVLHFSRRSAELFLAAAAPAGIDASRATHFCLSEDVAAPLREAGCPMIEIAKTPSEADLLARIEARH